ncbi:MAG: MFS transporter, partial [Acidobacteria bacterium]|nr:MFS transporter [Acidobacteriota bacterium]
MYQVEAWSALRRARRGAGAGLQWPHVRRNVWALGFTSLFTDVSSEMVGTVLPVYLVLYLGLTPFQFGIVDGLYHGVTALLRLASGVAVDRGGRAKEIAFAGYGASAACRLGLLAAGASWPLIASVVALDRAAKGARAVPRDVLISLSSRPDGLATSFGVHRALDSAGAMLGPLVALAILAALPNAFDVVFVTSFSVALVGLGVLALFVTNAERPPASTPAPARSLSGTPRAGAPLAGGPPAAAPPAA